VKSSNGGSLMKVVLLPLLGMLLAACGNAAAKADCPDDQQMGCPDSALTYDTGIGDLLTERCSPCHAAGGIEASVLLTDYDHVSRRQMSIASQIITCSMPQAPSPPLSLQERQEILDWLSCGGPR